MISYVMDVNNLYGWAMSQKLSVDGFTWVETPSQFNKNFIKSYNEDSDEGYFLKVGVRYPDRYMTFTMIYHVYLKE